jgi:hypothetical protein
MQHLKRLGAKERGEEQARDTIAAKSSLQPFRTQSAQAKRPASSGKTGGADAHTSEQQASPAKKPRGRRLATQPTAGPALGSRARRQLDLAMETSSNPDSAASMQDSDSGGDKGARLDPKTPRQMSHKLATTSGGGRAAAEAARHWGREAASTAKEAAPRRGRPQQKDAQLLVVNREMSPPKTRQLRQRSQPPPAPSTPPQPKSDPGSRPPAKSARATGSSAQRVHLQECMVDGHTYRRGDSAYVIMECGDVVRAVCCFLILLYARLSAERI